MSQKTLPGLPKPKGPIRRRVSIAARNGDQIICKTKSNTVREGVEYHPSIDVKDGTFHCDCKGACYRPGKPCSHVVKAALNLIRRGELDAIWLQRVGKNLCHKCGASEQLFPMCHDDGTSIHDVWICFGCIKVAESERMLKAPSAQEVAADAEIEPFLSPEEEFEAIREYLQERVNNGEYCHSRDWATFGLIEPSGIGASYPDTDGTAGPWQMASAPRG